MHMDFSTWVTARHVWDDFFGCTVQSYKGYGPNIFHFSLFVDCGAAYAFLKSLLAAECTVLQRSVC